MAHSIFFTNKADGICRDWPRGGVRGSSRTAAVLDLIAPVGPKSYLAYWSMLHRGRYMPPFIEAARPRATPLRTRSRRSRAALHPNKQSAGIVDWKQPGRQAVNQSTIVALADLPDAAEWAYPQFTGRVRPIPRVGNATTSSVSASASRPFGAPG